jgi:hypothetical protein
MCKHGASRFNDNSDHSFIGGGEKNEIRSEWNVIGGGQNNLIDVDTFGSKWSVIGGGRYNYDGQGGEYNIVVGGDSNLNNGGVSFMGGGQGNQVYNELGWATLGGGYWNFIGNIVTGRGPDYGSLVGGKQDTLAADYGAIGGGRENMVTVNAPNGTIPGGDSLIANSYGQTVVGYNNIQSSSVTKAQAVAGGAGGVYDNPLFIVGNGRTAAATNRFNAFQVSYDGHSTVFDVNGISRPAIKGSTYVDNVIYAWGDVPANGIPSNYFGVLTFLKPLGTVGTYIIRLNVAPTNLGSASITVTLRNNDTTNTTGILTLNTGVIPDAPTCGKVVASQIGIFTDATAFVVHTYSGSSACDLADEPFFFKVCGR